MMTRPLFWVLNERREPVPTFDVLEWGMMAAKLDARRVGFTDLGMCEVSTVFVGLDTGVTGVPLLFETMVFITLDTGAEAGDISPITCQRYATWDEAALGHADLCEEIAARIAVAQARADELTGSFLARLIEAP